ncbi:C-C motif chemokine 16-like, partial [Lepus europaeus]|uniref:C-C motif chemokine 16-like n=1 Tax=Lepus europaeus TaxID=9983 RepID=UPI002B47A11A
CLKFHEKALPGKLVPGSRKALSCHLPMSAFCQQKNLGVCTNPEDTRAQEHLQDSWPPLLPARTPAPVKTIGSERGQPQPQHLFH